MFNNELFLLIFGKYMKQLLSIKEKALKIVKSVRGGRRRNKYFPAATGLQLRGICL